jgi:hypothetical protein
MVGYRCQEGALGKGRGERAEREDLIRMEKQGMIETDLVCLVDKGETVSKCGSSDTTRRIGGVKREMEGKARIYNDDKWTYSLALAVFSAVPATTSALPRHFSLPFQLTPLRGISASTYTIVDRDLLVSNPRRTPPQNNAPSFVGSSFSLSLLSGSQVPLVI